MSIDPNVARTRVKLCGITRRADAEVAVRAGADAIGLVLWRGSPRAVEFDKARSIVAALPPFVSVVGLFVDPDTDAVRAALAAVRLDFLQFHGAEPASFCRSFGRPYLKAIAAADGVDLLESASRYEDASGLLFDAPPAAGMPGGTGRTFDWDRIPARLARPIVLSGGLSAANVAAAIRRVRPYAVDASSGVEATDAEGRPQKGIKDAAKIAAFMAEVRHADG